jgi:SAM-dependent methyltransferase
VTDYVRHNRRFWDEDADDYQAVHGDALADVPRAWGAWRIPEDELDVLGDVRGLDVLELGCGAARWSASLAPRGARPIGLDLSASQLRHARAARIPLVLANGEQTPFADESFDIVFSDHGVLSFCDPARSVPEAARLLRRGGLLAFCHTTALRILCDDGKRLTKKLQRNYFDMHRFDWEGEGTIDFEIPTGEWIRLFRANDLVIEDLIELRPPEDATTTYKEYITLKWARNWPGEQIWKVRKG